METKETAQKVEQKNESLPTGSLKVRSKIKAGDALIKCKETALSF